jgi:Rrf2 family transcriptional regulator, repressor of oqxAB
MSQPMPSRFGPVSPGWFAIAVQALAVLSYIDDVCASTSLAHKVGAHAVFLRRLLAPLVRAGIVEAREGRIGGYRLARQPEQITLGDIYRALQAGPAENIIPLEPANSPPINPALRRAFDEISLEVDAAILAVMDTHTLAELVERAKPYYDGPLPGNCP